MKLIVLGPPGTGKGTISRFIEAKFGCEHISTGDLLRTEVAKKTSLGIKIEHILKAGKLVSNEIAMHVLSKKICSLKDGFVLDGFPRNIEQARLFDELLIKQKISLDIVLEVDSDDQVVIERLSSRRQCIKCKKIYGHHVPSKKLGVCDDCGKKTIIREDDKPKAIKQRLKIYHETTKHLVNFYSNKKLLLKINGNQTLEKIFPQIEKILKKVV